MPANHWMIKSEPESYSWSDLVADKKTAWTGVRNFQARNNLAAMKRGDRVLFYHSVSDKAVVGIAKVARQSYRDPTSEEERWVCVDVAPVRALKRPVGLDEIKANAALKDILLLRNSRLSVIPLTAAEFDEIVQMGSR